MVLGFTVSVAAKAQDDKDKTKPTTTVTQKVHNNVSKHKKYKGYKTKHKDEAGKTNHEVNVKKGKEEIKEK